MKSDDAELVYLLKTAALVNAFKPGGRVKEPMNNKLRALPAGMHQMSTKDFLERYCYVGDIRWIFAQPVERISKWAASVGATSMIVGGSIVSDKEHPSDVDVVVLFKRSQDIRKCPESLFVSDVKVDVQFVGEDNPDLVDAFIYLFGISKYGSKRGVVQIKLDASVPSLTIPEEVPILYQTALDAYDGRDQHHVHRNKGLIIPIHGVNTDAAWLSYFSLIASSSGWGLAPFVYGKESVTTLARPRRRDALVDKFSQWLNEVRTVHEGPICIFAHSLGTYLFARYLSLSVGIDERFCGIVFSGSIVSSNFDWRAHFDGKRIAAVMNTSSTRDAWVARMKEGGALFMRDDLYGRAGVDGFSQDHERLFEKRVNLFQHSNVFKADAIRMWMSFFELSLKYYRFDQSELFSPRSPPDRA